MQENNKVFQFFGKKNKLIERCDKELAKLAGISLHSFAEDIYHNLITMELADNEVDLLLADENVLTTLATAAQDNDLYDSLIEVTIDDFLGRK